MKMSKMGTFLLFFLLAFFLKGNVFAGKNFLIKIPTPPGHLFQNRWVEAWDESWSSSPPYRIVSAKLRGDIFEECTKKRVNEFECDYPQDGDNSNKIKIQFSFSSEKTPSAWDARFQDIYLNCSVQIIHNENPVEIFDGEKQLYKSNVWNGNRVSIF